MSGPITTGEEARLSPSLHTRRLQLRMLTNEDHAPLYRLSSDPDVTFQWRFRGTTPSYDEFLKQLYPGVLCQFVVSPHGSQEVLGLVVAYNAAATLASVLDRIPAPFRTQVVKVLVGVSWKTVPPPSVPPT